MNLFKKEYIIGLGTFFVGALFFCVYQEILIIHVGTFKKDPVLSDTPVESKKVTLFFWKHNNWKQEVASIMWAQDMTQTILTLTNRYFNILDEEDIVHKKVLVQSVVFDKTKTTAYLSFDQIPFSKEASTHEKLMIIEGLLKTLRESDVTIPFYHFLIHHKPIIDPHLHFNHPWQLCGYID